MHDILAPGGRRALARLARSRALLAFDFDGTLAPIVTRPARAALRPATRRLLRQLAEAYPCVVISGRSRSDVARRLRGVSLRAVVGNHGLEPSRIAGSARRAVRRWASLLAERLHGVSGVVIENKGLSLAVHYRRSREKRRARRLIRAAVAGLDGIRLLGGKQVLNVLPATALHKGQALDRARARLGCDTALYVGDDETDEDVFALARPGLLSVRVGRKAGSVAAWFLRRQTLIDFLLRSLLDLRPGTRQAARRGL